MLKSDCRLFEEDFINKNIVLNVQITSDDTGVKIRFIKSRVICFSRHCDVFFVLSVTRKKLTIEVATYFINFSLRKPFYVGTKVKL